MPDNSIGSNPAIGVGSTHTLARAETWIFDLDNTLYPASCNLFHQVDWNITRFVAELLGLPRDEARKIQKDYLRDHGTTMRGLMTHHGVDPREFMDYVHDIDLSPVEPSPRLDAALAALPGRKLIFTNGDVPHAERVMDRLGVRRHFEAVFDIVASDFVPKPRLEVYEKLTRAHDVDPARAVMVEDMPRNLVPAHALGMATVWVRTDSPWAQDLADGDHIHHAVDDLVDWLEEIAGIAAPPGGAVS